MPMATAEVTAVQVSINGDQVSGLLGATIVTTNCFSADTYSLTFAIGREASNNVTFWSAISSAYVEVSVVGSSGFGLASQSLITGMADAINIDLIRGTVGVEGRDLSSSLIDAYRQQDFVNQTASEVVSAVAQYHGLQPVVTPTTGNIGRYYGDGYTKLSLGQFSSLQSDWDLLVQLARQCDFDVFVRAQTLYFQPSSISTIAPVPIAVRDVQSARIERSLNITSSTTARVQSWNSQNMAAYDSGGPGGVASQDGSTSNPPFLFSGSNYTSQQVTDSADRYSAELARLGTVLQLEMPWRLTLSPRTSVILTDTNSPLDTIYRIDSIDRHYSSTRGSTQSVLAAQI